MVAMNPQTWDAGRRRDRARRLPASTTARKPLPPSKFRDDIHVIGVPLTDICNDALHRPARAPAVQEHRLRRRARGAARHRARGDRDAARRAVQGQGEAAAAQPRRLACWACDYAQRVPRRRARPPGASARDAVGKRIFIDGNAAAALGCVYGGATVCAWYPITPSLVARRGVPEVLREAARRQGDRQEQVRDRAGRGRDRLDRHGRRRRLERRARVHRDVGPGHLADDRVHRPRLLRRDPGDDHRRAARRPVDRHADAHAAGRHPALRLRVARRHQARAAVSRRSARVLRLRGARRSTSPTACRRRCSS